MPVWWPIAGPVPRWRSLRLAGLLALLALLLCAGGRAQVEIRAPQITVPPAIDGVLDEWPEQALAELTRRDQVVRGESWSGPDDGSLRLWLAYDRNHLYIAGEVRDDLPAAGPVATVDADAIELRLGFAPVAAETGKDSAAAPPWDWGILLHPLDDARPWSILDPTPGGVGGTGPLPRRPLQGGSALTGFQLRGQRVDELAYRFEAAVPFHQLTDLRPGQDAVRLGVVLHDRDPAAAAGGEADDVELSWTGAPLSASGGLGRLRFDGDPPLSDEDAGRLLGADLLRDLQYLLVPLLMVVALLLLSRVWPAAQRRARWLRPTVLAAGAILFAIGLVLPSLWLELRDGSQQRGLRDAHRTVRNLVDKLEQGTLASYRGASRDRALMDLLAGRVVARQKYTSYRFLSQIAQAELGAQVRDLHGEFPVRPYWLPLEEGRVETFNFDPPLQGEELYVVVGRGRGAVGALPFSVPPAPRLRLELTYDGDSQPVVETLVYDGEFLPGDALGDDQFGVDWRRVPLEGRLRTLAVRRAEEPTADPDFDPTGDEREVRLVGLTLLESPGDPEPLFLGTASLDGVLTDLRGPYPEDAGLELGPGARTRVPIPELPEPAQKLWLFYRASYPGVPTANPGATVGEVVLHFTGDHPPRKLLLEHQVSMFYELAVHNTRDEPPEGSPAAIAFEWIDRKTNEREINTVLPVTDLPADAALEAIEFRNLADYRMRFRSVVFGTEKSAAPQDPEDSPLVRVGQDRRLADDVLAALQGTTIAIYRNGRLSEATLPQDQRQDLLALPRESASHADADRPLVTALPPGDRRVAVYTPLLGDGWDGAVMAVMRTDQQRPAVARTASRTGLLLCLLGAPLLLVLLSELLAALANLRIRLMAVLSVAAVAPLVLLSFLLAQVLEESHESDQKEGMQSLVRSARQQLSDQMTGLRTSAEQWLADLTQLYGQQAQGDDAAQLAARFEEVRPALQRLLGGQLPPEWRGGFLRLDWNPGSAATGRTEQQRPIVAGDRRLATTEAPARLEPGVYVHWGTVVISVRSEAEVPGGMVSLTAARPLGADFLGALAPGHSVLLCDTRGYPLEVAAAEPVRSALMRHGMRPVVMNARERALYAGLDRGEPVVDQSASVDGSWLCGYTVLSDLQETPRGLLVVAQPSQRATLDLAIGRIPVRAFFFLVAGLLFVLSGFLSFVLSHRISRPVEQLERSALSIARGELATRVPVEEGGQLGRLSRAFNRMATDLEGRLRDLQNLNRVMRELSSQLDTGHTLHVLRRFCEQHGPVDRVRIALLRPESSQIELYGGAESERFEAPSELEFLPRASGAFCLCWPGGEPRAGLLRRLPGIHSVVGLPLLVGGRCRGAVLLLFESAVPGEMDLDLLATVVAQAAVALDNAQLYRHAVQDPVTGALVPDYFRRRVAEEVALAQQHGAWLSLVGLDLGEQPNRPRGLRRLASLLRRLAPAGASLCHAGGGRFELLLPGADRGAAAGLVDRVLDGWRELVVRSGDGDIERQPLRTAAVTYPEEAASTEFLFDALRDQLERDDAPPGPVEVDSSLRAAGVVAVSPVMREVYRTLRRVAPTDLAILLLGETGAGKEVLTNLAHRWSRRAHGPLVKVHCAALSETLLASELFGHEKGAFTGADRRKIGKFEQADGGTILLDEVGEIPLDVQVKLLRVLQEREVDRVGGVDPVPVDVRVIAATNRDLEQMVREGRFREDLYYRLQGIVVHVPPLRQRKHEIPALVELFRAEVVASGQSRVRAFSTDALDELYRREWPGNIRELRNAVYRAMVLASSEIVERRDVLAALPPGEVRADEVVARRADPPPESAGGSRLGPAAGAAARSDAPASRGSRSSRSDAVSADRPAAAERNGPAGAAPADAADAGDAGDAADAVAAAGLRPSPADGLDTRSHREPAVELPRPEPELRDAATAARAPAAGGDPRLRTLPDRVRALYDRLQVQGLLGTRDHMAAAGVSHRTALRDLQLLVDLGLAERVGRRRGARYRPVPAEATRS